MSENPSEKYHREVIDLEYKKAVIELVKKLPQILQVARELTRAVRDG